VFTEDSLRANWFNVPPMPSQFTVEALRACGFKVPAARGYGFIMGKVQTNKPDRSTDWQLIANGWLAPNGGFGP
jgi:hypothetical protein